MYQPALHFISFSFSILGLLISKSLLFVGYFRYICIHGPTLSGVDQRRTRLPTSRSSPGDDTYHHTTPYFRPSHRERSPNSSLHLAVVLPLVFRHACRELRPHGNQRPTRRPPLGEVPPRPHLPSTVRPNHRIWIARSSDISWRFIGANSMANCVVHQPINASAVWACFIRPIKQSIDHSLDEFNQFDCTSVFAGRPESDGFLRDRWQIPTIQQGNLAFYLWNDHFWLGMFGLCGVAERDAIAGSWSGDGW